MTLGFVFPGQGSQSVGMLSALAAEFPLVEQTFREASSALERDLWQLVTAGPEQELNRTENTQPAMLAAGVAVWRVWQERGGPAPVVMAGHSLGEYSALVCAGALDFPEAVRLVADRGRFMQEAVPAGEGAMAAILGLEDADVQKLCEACAEDQVLAPVNFNSPGQVVIAGAAAAVQRALDRAGEFGARRAVPLPVSVPSHCRLMAPAAERMRQRLQAVDLRPPRIPVLHNAHVRSESDPDAIRRALAAQVESPVRWVETITKMAAEGVDTLIESGPGRVLAGLNRRIRRGLKTYPVEDPQGLEQALAALNQ